MLWYKFCCTVVALVLRFVFGLKVRVQGRDNIPRAGGFILASNHASNLDPMVLGISCPRGVNYMAKEELFRRRFFGRLLFSVGAFPVKRGTGDLRAIRTALTRVKKGGGLLLFPQGGRRPLNDTGDPEPGVGMLSQRMAVPVVPAYIDGTDRALPPGSKDIVKGTTITVRYGAPLSLEPGRDYRQTAMAIMNAIRSLANG